MTQWTRLSKSKSLKDSKGSGDLYILIQFSIGVQSVTDVVRLGRLRWFGQLERRVVENLMSASRNGVVAGVRCVGMCGICGGTLYMGQTLNPSLAWDRF